MVQKKVEPKKSNTRQKSSLKKSRFAIILCHLSPFSQISTTISPVGMEAFGLCGPVVESLISLRAIAGLLALD